MNRTAFLAGCMIAFAAVTVTVAAKSKGASAPTMSAVGQTNLELAQNYLEENDLAAALERAKRAVSSDPKFGETHALLGLVYTRTGQMDKAGPEFATAIKLAPASGAVLNAHAVWLCEQNQFESADTEFRQAMADPFYRTPDQARFNAARCAQKAGRSAIAEAYLRPVVASAPNYPPGLLLLAQIEFAQGQWMEARAFVQRYLALMPNADALDLAAKIEDAAGDHAAAARYRQQRHDLFPELPPAADGAHRP